MLIKTPKSVEIADVRHIKVGYSKDTYRGHPRHCGMFNFGQGELAVTYNRAPCAYERYDDTGHDFHYMEHSEQVLARSLDNGETWPESEDVIVWHRGGAIDDLRARLWPEKTAREDVDWCGPWDDSQARDELDMSQPGACFFFGRCWAGKVVQDPRRGGAVPMYVTFSLRSVDKGRTWEKIPTLFAPPAHAETVLLNAHPPVHMPDGSFLVVLTVGGGGDPNSYKEAALYMSDDNGLSWEFIAPIARDPHGIWGYTYSALIMLPSGRLQCYTMRQNINTSQGNWACMTYSDDGGLSWTEPRPIGQLGYSPWVTRRRTGHYSRPRTVRDPAGRPMQTYEPLPTGAAVCRSPYPLLLRDGRIVVLYGRRKPPYGMGGWVSEDEGQTWSQEFVLRDDAHCGDLGYPVATELDDGRIFTAYYYNLDDGNEFGGTRFIAGSFFRLVG
jgi:hypothetical protein